MVVPLIFKEGPQRVFELGLNCRDDNKVGLQSIIITDPSKKSDALIRKLKTGTYARYWVKNP